jgi:excisionase family DNA binding protein
VTDAPHLRAELVIPEDTYRALVHEITAAVMVELEHDWEHAGSPWYAEAEAARYLRISERTLQRLSAKERVRSTAVGRRRLYHRDELNRLAAGEETAPTAPPRRRVG